MSSGSWRGAQAEYLVTHERMAMPIPAQLDFVEAAAVPEVFITAHDALDQPGPPRPGERVLLHAVGSGVGTAAAQVAHAMGCTVFGTSRTSEKLRQALSLGVDVAIETSRDEFAEVVRRETSGGGVQVVLDLFGAGTLASNLRAHGAARPAGRGGLARRPRGPARSGTPAGQAAHRDRYQSAGASTRGEDCRDPAVRTSGDSLVRGGLVRPVVDKVFPYQDVREAHSRMESNQTFGKVILRF